MIFKIISKKISIPIIKISLIAAAVLLTVSATDRYSYLGLFAQTLNLIKINYLEPIKTETLIYAAIKGLLREIDPYSHFFAS